MTEQALLAIQTVPTLEEMLTWLLFTWLHSQVNSPMGKSAIRPEGAVAFRPVPTDLSLVFDGGFSVS
jgi:hypothetical protein